MLILLCGFMGCGKSTMLKKCEKNSLGAVTEDLDQLIAHFLSISPFELGTWIRENGISSFRELEKKILKRALDRYQYESKVICSLGGGALNSQTWPMIESAKTMAVKNSKLFKVIWLDTPFELCWQRIEKDLNRPMAQNGRSSAHELYLERLSEYKKADLVFDLNMQESVHDFASFDKLIQGR